ncbi:hypothetical protein [Alienimonas chondri]|uniref:Esterase n=1 Tax=Alienimonas chondri TaxID=2681879 RepID=A0ABX1VK07_9PLAN|nr:hypothetical protein [Alienimonas chondri]NNJ27106.1 hypothetical protein [Alienimonas chondri]
MSRPAAEWSETTVDGVPALVFEPPQAPDGGVVWLADFDALTPASLPSWGEALASRGVRFLCPRPGPTWWLDRDDPAFQPASGGGEEGPTPWRWLLDVLAPQAAERFGGPIAWAGAGAGGQAAIRAGFKRRSTPAVWAYAAAVQLDAVHGRGSTLDRLFPDSPERNGREQARVAGVLTDVNPLARPQRLHLACDPSEIWAPGCELLAEKLRSGGVPLESDFAPRSPSDREAALNAAGPAAVRLLADALTFAV